MTLGPLVPADETFHHQITDTFAAVAQADRAWTEKVWAQACAHDGSLQLALGLGKYTNRGVMDAYAGVSRGVEQWTVRASRALTPSSDATVVGPIRCEVLEPLRRVRFTLDATDAAPLRFEWELESVVPPVLERREQHRSPDGARLEADVVRYHHIGTASGWVELDGVRVELDAATWTSTRDHSWGVRYQVGGPLEDGAPGVDRSAVSSLVMWCPLACRAADGAPYGLHWYYQRHALGDWSRTELQGGVERPDGRREPFAAMTPELRFDPVTRRFVDGALHCVMTGGGERTLELRALSDTGFHLGPALYFGYEGHWHGQWRGPLHVEAEHHADCTEPHVARRVHQLRDCVVRVDDPEVGGVGYGVLQSLVTGAHPEMGLDADSSFV